MQRCFAIRGKVQNVMFRQTFIRACEKRHIEAGATNDKQDKNKVLITMKGDAQKIQEIVSHLQSGKPINSWNAHATDVEEILDEKHALSIDAHQGNAIS